MPVFLNFEVLVKLNDWADKNTVWTVDFEAPVCKLYLLFFSADAAKEKEKKVLLHTSVSKSAAHTVIAHVCYTFSCL